MHNICLETLWKGPERKKNKTNKNPYCVWLGSFWFTLIWGGDFSRVVWRRFVYSSLYSLAAGEVMLKWKCVLLCVCTCVRGQRPLEGFLRLAWLTAAVWAEGQAKSCLSCGFDSCPGQVTGARHSKPAAPLPRPGPLHYIKRINLFGSARLSLHPSFQMRLALPSFG